MLMVVNCLSARSLMQRPVEPSIFLEQVAFLFLPTWLALLSSAHVSLRVSLRSSLPTSHTEWWCRASSAEHLRSKNYNSRIFLFLLLLLLACNPWGSSKVAVSCVLVKLIQGPRLDDVLLLNREPEVKNVQNVGWSADEIGWRWQIRIWFSIARNLDSITNSIGYKRQSGKSFTSLATLMFFHGLNIAFTKY